MYQQIRTFCQGEEGSLPLQDWVLLTTVLVIGILPSMTSWRSRVPTSAPSQAQLELRSLKR
jgi:hypothetical protein